MSTLTEPMIEALEREGIKTNRNVSPDGDITLPIKDGVAVWVMPQLVELGGKGYAVEQPGVVSQQFEHPDEVIQYLRVTGNLP